MTKNTVAIRNRLGLHARAAAKLVRLASQYDCEVRLSLPGRKGDADGKSILSIVLLAAGFGRKVCIRAQGHDETEAVEALTRLVKNRFGEAQ